MPGYAKQRSNWQDFPTTSTPILAANLNGLEQAIFDVKTTVYHPKDFGTLAWNGSTDDSVTLQAAVDQASTDNAVVQLPRGTGRGIIVAKPNVEVRGYGSGTILKAPSGSNADVVKGLNFATLTGKAKATGDYALGAYNFALRDLTIDGDKATQSAGYGVRIWGRRPSFSNVEIINCKQDGLWTEFTDVDSFLDPIQVLEGYASNLSIHHCDGNGWTHRGPHDFKCMGGPTIFDCVGWGLRVELSAGSYNGGLACYLPNIYLCANGTFAGGSALTLLGGATGCQGTTSSGTCLEFAAGQGSNRVLGTVVGGGQIGLWMRGSNHVIDCQVSTTQTGLKVDGAGLCTVRLTGAGNSVTAVNVVSESQPNLVTGKFDVPAAAALKTGAAWSNSDSVDLSGHGAGGNFWESEKPNVTTRVQGWSPQFPGSNSVMVVSDYASVASAATIAIPGEARTITVTGTTTITSVTARAAGYRVTLIFAGILTFTDGSNLKLAGNFVTTADDTITLVCDGTNWFEVARAVN